MDNEPMMQCVKFGYVTKVLNQEEKLKTNILCKRGPGILSEKKAYLDQVSLEQNEFETAWL